MPYPERPTLNGKGGFDMFYLNKRIIPLSQESGLSLIELIVAVAIMGVLVIGAITYHTAAYKSTTLNQDRAFCIQKSIQLINELRERTAGTDTAASLAPYDQVIEDANGNILNSFYSPVLSLQLEQNLAIAPNAPADPLSGNINTGNGWKFQRQIDVRRFDYSQPVSSEEPMMVTVRCFYSNPSNPSQGGLPLAETTSVMRKMGNSLPTSQTFDLYVLAVDTVPGWWVSLGNLRPIINTAVNQLQASNPGLNYRMHYITRSAFGRDKSYTPFLNTPASYDSVFNYPAVLTNPYSPIEPAYYYPGLLETTPGSPEFEYYRAAFLNQGKINPGRVVNIAGVGNVGIPNSNVTGYTGGNVPLANVAGIVRAGLLYDPQDPPNTLGANLDDDHYLVVRYALADYFNHAVRYPEELTEYCMRKYGNLPQRNPNKNNIWDCLPADTSSAAPFTLPTGMTYADFVQRYTEPTMEPSLRLLLEQLYQDPASYQNILILNAHGEMLPVPPMRNYSDPAKNPNPGGTNTDPTVSGFPGVRVVTHPEQLEYQNGSDVVLRVYSYVTPETMASTLVGCNNALPQYGPTAILDSDCDPTTANTANKDNEVPIVVRISGVNFSGYNITSGTGVTGTGNIEVRRIRGNPGAGYSGWGSAPTSEAAEGAGSMWYEAFHCCPLNSGPDLIVLLYNSPLRHDLAASPGASPPYTTAVGSANTGLPSTRRLYGMEYIPAFTGDPANLAANPNYDLSSVSSSNYKNTARWTITLLNTGGVLDNQQLTIETRIAPRRVTGEADSTYITRALYLGYDPANPYSYIPDLPAGAVVGSAGLYMSGGTYDFVTANNVPSDVSRTYTWLANINCTSGTTGCNIPTSTGRAGQTGMEGLDFPVNGFRAPFTERFQFMGDPRHSPYWDVKADHRYNWYFVDDATMPGAPYDVAPYNTAAGRNSPLNSNGFAGFTPNASDGWSNGSGGTSNPGKLPFDYPRFAEVYRMGILKSRSIFNSITGWGFFYTDPGSAIGGDKLWLVSYNTVWTDAVRVPLNPFRNRNNIAPAAAKEGNNTYNTGSNFIDLDEIAGSHGNWTTNGPYGRTRVLTQWAGTGSWYAKPWLGEIYPDITNSTNYYAAANIGWKTRGNLPTSIFNQDTEEVAYLGYNATRSNENNGPPSFFNSVTLYNHNPTAITTNQTAIGVAMTKAIKSTINFSINAQRPFQIHDTSSTPPENGAAPYNTSNLRTTVSLFAPFYCAGGTPPNPPTPGVPSTCGGSNPPSNTRMGSALLQVRQDPDFNPAGASTSSSLDANTNAPNSNDLFGYFVMNGLQPAGVSNPETLLTTVNLSTLTYGFMLTGQPTHPVTGAALPLNPATGTPWNSIRQLPRVEVVGPDPGNQAALTSPSSLTIQWNITWRRWDGLPYTPAYQTNFAEKTPLYYVLMYSDGGPWRYVIGDNDLVPTPPDDWTSRAALPVQDGGKYTPSMGPNKIHFICEGANTPDCPGDFATMNTTVLQRQYTWNVSGLNLNLGGSNNPPGQTYTIRVVVHRKNIYNHFAYHDLQFVLRP
jgi:type II secretory pathway pseudopilin PulG